MSQGEDVPPPMDQELRSLLRGAKTAYDAEANLHADRAFERLSRVLPDVASPAASVATAAAKAGLAAKLAVPVLSAVLGGLLGAGITYVARPARERIVYVDRPVMVSVAAPPPSAAPPSIRVEDLPTAQKSASPSSPSSSPGDVSAERLLLDEARVAFAAGDYSKSLERLERHRARFPSGVLAEEREALAVRALAARGDKVEATKRARSFVAKYPESIMRPAVEAAVNDR